MGGAGRFQRAQVLRSGEHLGLKRRRQGGRKWRPVRRPCVAPLPAPEHEAPWSGLGCPQNGHCRSPTAGLPCIQSTVSSRGSPAARLCPGPKIGIGVRGSGRHVMGAPKVCPWALGPLRSEPALPSPRPRTRGLFCARSGNPFSVSSSGCPLAARRGPSSPGSAWTVSVLGCASGPRSGQSCVQVAVCRRCWRLPGP